VEALLFRRDLAVLHAQEALTALMQKKSETPLILAARGGHSEACLLLLRYPNIDSRYGLCGAKLKDTIVFS
jgi:hypothetical protein